MLSVLPIEQPERGDALTLPTLDQASLHAIADPWRRSQLADTLAKQLAALSTAVLKIRSEAVRELVHQHSTPQALVARHLGVSKTRINQLVTRPAEDATDDATAVA